MGLQNLSDHAWRGHEVVLCVLCAYTAFYGMAMLADVFLMELKRLTIGYENLLFHQIHSHHFFGDGMLHLKTGVHFQKIKLMVFVNKELNRASTLISNSFGCGYGFGSHLVAKVEVEERRRAFFHNLLMSTLNRAFTVEEMNDIAEFVA